MREILAYVHRVIIMGDRPGSSKEPTLATMSRQAPCPDPSIEATMLSMHVAFVVHVVKGVDPEELLSAETKESTQAVVMSMEDAGKMGFGASGVQVKPGQEACLIVVARRDAPWIARSLEQHDKVAGFQQVDVNIG